MNEWNGKVRGGCGKTWHCKIVRVGPELENSPCWRDGGYSVWREFEVILSQGTVANEHFWDTLAIPAGLGGYWRRHAPAGNDRGATAVKRRKGIRRMI